MTILDTTVRDGSYAVDFKFSCKDVRDIVQKSAKIGIEFIEIGHGLGIGASSPEHGISLHTDLEYLKTAKSVSGTSKLGFFCIPGIAKINQLKKLKNNGLDFIRIGVTVRDFPSAIPYIDVAVKESIFVFVNFMKTYASSPVEFAEAAKIAYEHGVKCVYIVDSAGNMCWDEILDYYKLTRARSNVCIGFHGHNNLGLAVENTVKCALNGFDFIDCTYQGLGRSVGNASLEQVIMVLERKGIQTGFDIPRVLEYGYSGLRNIVRDRTLINPLDYMCGYAGFHSSFLKDIYKCCMEKQVDPLRLILAYSQENKMIMDYDRLCEIASKLPIDLDDNPYGFAEFFSDKYND